VATRSSIPNEFEDFILSTAPKFKPFCRALFTLLTKQCQCSSDIRGDYVTFNSGNGLVAALYVNRAEVDVILALPPDKSDKNLFDAVDKNYKWRTLPVGICVKSPAKAKIALERAKQAHDLVSSGVIQQQDGQTFSIPKAAFQPAFKKKFRFR
jgi:hypothetical protein